MGPETDAQKIQQLFGSIAGTYDKVNNMMTFGMVQSWRLKLVEWSGAKKGDHILDCTTGTGDLAIHFKKAVGPHGRVVGSDFCKEMLEYASQKAELLGHEIVFEWGDATNLKYKDNSFHISSMAYGIRNVNNPKKALSEMARVVKPHGYVMILETGRPRSPLLKAHIDFYFNYLVPYIGGWVSGNYEAYNYLNTSSKIFPSGDKFVDLVMSTGLFRWVHSKPPHGGS